MKVLHVIPSLAATTGGTAFAVVQMARAARMQGATTSVFTTDLATAPQAKVREGGAALADMPAGTEDVDVHVFAVAPPSRLAYSPALGEALRDRVPEFDLVHVHSLFLYPQYVAGREARRRDVPYIVSPHGVFDPYLRERGRLRKWVTDVLWQRRMLNFAELILCTSDTEKNQLAELGFRTSIAVCPIGIGDEWFEPSADLGFRHEVLDGFDGPLIAYHGRIAEKKGLDVLIKAFAQVSATVDCRLLVIGPDEDALADTLRSLASSLGVSSKVYFLGSLRDKQLRGALWASDVWAMPSHGENFGLAVVEALSSGLPVVISPEINLADVIQKSGAGLVTARNVECFAEAILMLIENPEMRRGMSESARSFAKRFDWRVSGSQLLTIYESIMAVRAAGSAP